uniref:Uncharacterized protein n=1 Tax=Arundo donax TaxID=35708 RepID=A0A0A9AH23_ARUDO
MWFSQVSCYSHINTVQFDSNFCVELTKTVT